MDKLQIQKRNGALVDFNLNKINIAISKAFEAVDSKINDLSVVTNQIYTTLNEKFISKNILLTIENVQDVAEDVLMRTGYSRVAKAYIKYRQTQFLEREGKREEIKEEAKKAHVYIINEKGREELFDEQILRSDLEKKIKDLDNLSIDVIIDEIEKNLYKGISKKELKLIILNTIRGLIERHYDYSSLASRILWSDLYKKVLGSNDEQGLKKGYQESFKEYISRGIKLGILNPELAKFDLEKILSAIVIERDNNFHYLGAQTINDRYLQKTPDEKHEIFELPQWFWMRVAMGLSLKEEDREEKAIEFYNLMSQFLLVPSTPTLFNSGTTHSQLSSCYLNTVEDSLTGIFKAYADVAQLSKWAGGVGSDWTPVRAMGSLIKGTNGASQGIIPFIKVFNDIAVAVNQGGKRRGALSAYLEVWHADIEEFLELKKNTGDERRRAHDIHPVAWIPDLFMERVAKDEDWTLFSPNVVPDLHELYGKKFEKKYREYEQDEKLVARKIKAKDLWKKMLTMLYETGHPWITFKDACNVRSPQDHEGVIHGSNLCTEITLNSSKDEIAVCNLASINLAKMIKGGKVDEELVASTIKTGMRMLDNVIDVNFYPVKETENSNAKHRPVGLGVMGYHDALYQQNISFDSGENIEFADYSQELISYHAIKSSIELAKERGAYQTYKGSKWDRGFLPYDTMRLLEEERGVMLDVNKDSKLDWGPVRESLAKYGIRNSNTMAIAPTATIANITGVVPCVEPIFKNIYMKENMSGSFLVVNRSLIDDLKEINLWNSEIVRQLKNNDGSVREVKGIPQNIKDKYKEVFEIEPEWILKAAARRSKWLDQSASTNIFVSTTSGKVLNDIYMSAWKMGLKTTYYLRTLAASQISKSDASLSEQNSNEIKACSIDDPECEACQ